LNKGNNFTRPHVHPTALYTTVLSGTWWVGTGSKFDPANLTVPMKPGTFVTHFADGVHWDGAKDEDVTLLIIGEGPVISVRVQETRSRAGGSGRALSRDEPRGRSSSALARHVVHRDFHPVPPALLGVIERLIGLRQQFRQVDHRVVAKHHADRERGGDRI